MTGLVTAVGRSAGHTFGKPTEDGIRLLAGSAPRATPTRAGP
jgi:hypothetical protein